MKILPLTTAILFTLLTGAGAAVVKLEPDARWQLEFPQLPDTLATIISGERQPARLTVQLPANYSRTGKFPLFVFLNGGDGGRADGLPIDRTTVGSNDFICVNLPLFKRAFDKKDGGLITIDDFETLSGAYRAMLEKLTKTIPNITRHRSAIGGFSNGAHGLGCWWLEKTSSYWAALSPFISLKGAVRSQQTASGTAC
jgi:hypothetical protein